MADLVIIAQIKRSFIAAGATHLAAQAMALAVTSAADEAICVVKSATEHLPDNDGPCAALVAYQLLEELAHLNAAQLDQLIRSHPNVRQADCILDTRQ